VRRHAAVRILEPARALERFDHSEAHVDFGVPLRTSVGVRSAERANDAIVGRRMGRHAHDRSPLKLAEDESDDVLPVGVLLVGDAMRLHAPRPGEGIDRLLERLDAEGLAVGDRRPVCASSHPS